MCVSVVCRCPLKMDPSRSVLGRMRPSQVYVPWTNITSDIQWPVGRCLPELRIAGHWRFSESQLAWWSSGQMGGWGSYNVTVEDTCWHGRLQQDATRHQPSDNIVINVKHDARNHRICNFHQDPSLGSFQNGKRAYRSGKATSQGWSKILFPWWILSRPPASGNVSNIVAQAKHLALVDILSHFRFCSVFSIPGPSEPITILTAWTKSLRAWNT